MIYKEVKAADQLLNNNLKSLRCSFVGTESCVKVSDVLSIFCPGNEEAANINLTNNDIQNNFKCIRVFHLFLFGGKGGWLVGFFQTKGQLLETVCSELELECFCLYLEQQNSLKIPLTIEERPTF